MTRSAVPPDPPVFPGNREFFDGFPQNRDSRQERALIQTFATKFPYSEPRIMELQSGINSTTQKVTGKGFEAAAEGHNRPAAGKKEQRKHLEFDQNQSNLSVFTLPLNLAFSEAEILYAPPKTSSENGHGSAVSRGDERAG